MLTFFRTIVYVTATFSRPKGFTIIELLLVLVVMGIILSVTTFVFRSFVMNADKVAAQAAADRVIQSEQVIAKSYGQYTPYPNDLVASVGNDLTLMYGTANASAKKQVSVRVSQNGMLGVAAGYSNGRCVYYRVDPLVAGGNREEITKPENTICNGAEALEANDPPAADSGPSGSLKTD